MEDRTFSYDFYLITQEGGEFDQCWMTEAVQIVPNEEPLGSLLV